MNLADFLADQLDRTRNWTLDLIKDLDEQACDKQPRDGVQNIHWILGHLTFAEEILILTRCLGRKETAPDFVEPFKRGKTCTPSDLPPLSRVRKEMDRIHELCLAAIREISPEELTEPTLGNPHPMFTDKQGALLHASRHEGFHAGQIALIRRLLGKSPLR